MKLPYTLAIIGKSNTRPNLKTNRQTSNTWKHPIQAIDDEKEQLYSELLRRKMPNGVIKGCYVYLKYVKRCKKTVLDGKIRYTKGMYVIMITLNDNM